MNITVMSLFTGTDDFTKAKVKYLEEEGEKLHSCAESKGQKYDSRSYSNASQNYHNRMLRLIHYLFACQNVKLVEESRYTIDSLKNYFATKVELQKDLNRCSLYQDTFGRLNTTENLKFSLERWADKAGYMIHNDKDLTQKIIQYVNQQEKLFFSLLPRSDQCKILYSIYRDKFCTFIREPEVIFTIVLSTLVFMTLSIVIILPNPRER